MSNQQRVAASPSSRAASDAMPFEVAASMSSRPPNGAPAKTGFSSVAPSDAPRGGGAETKLYQVPRELIEIARANARNRSRAPVGTLTPIAPRPDAEAEANAKAYAAMVGDSPAAPSDIRQLTDALSASDAPPASSGTRLAITAEHTDAQTPEAERSGAEAEPRIDVAPAGQDDERVVHDAEREAASAGAPLMPSLASGRIWLYASLLVALGYCAQLALGW